MEHSGEDLTGFIADLWGQPLADAIADVIDPITGCAELRESWGGLGHADATTIAIRTRGIPLWLSAIALVHEYGHYTRSRPVAEATGNGEATDPETDDSNPCASCNEAMMGVDDVGRMGDVCNEETSSSERFSICQTVWQSRRAIAQLLTDCSYAGCTSCCGFGYIPNVDEILQIPTCCQN